jgi:hypothetical protein
MTTDDDKITNLNQFKEAKHRLASHPGTSPDLLNKLAQKDSPELLERVAENAQTTYETLDQLSTNEGHDVRGAVSENQNTSDEALQALASDENPDVRFRMAANAQIPVAVLETLAEDENPYVVARAQETLGKVKSLAQQADEMFLKENFAEAEDLYRKLIAGLQEMLGCEHHEVSEAMHKLAAVLVSQGKSAEAESTEERASLISAVHKEVS